MSAASGLLLENSGVTFHEGNTRREEAGRPQAGAHTPSLVGTSLLGEPRTARQVARNPFEVMGGLSILFRLLSSSPIYFSSRILRKDSPAANATHTG